MSSVSSAPEVWREGERIRRIDSIGYSDRVSDGTIWEHLAEHVVAKDLGMVDFCASVLKLRRMERARAALASESTLRTKS